MNETKEFRAWEKSEKRFVPDKKICLLQNGDVLYFESPTDYNFKAKKWFDIQFYIGQEDKKGRKIFEGDFVKRYGEVIEVEFDERGWDGESDAYIGYLDCSRGDVEIIGNNKENPELLTKCTIK